MSERSFAAEDFEVMSDGQQVEHLADDRAAVKIERPHSLPLGQSVYAVARKR